MSSHAFIRRDEVLFLLLWSSGYIGAKFGLPHAGNYTLLFLRYVLCVEVAVFVVSIRGDWQHPYISTFITGFLAHFVWLDDIFKAFEFGIRAGAAALFAAM